MLGTQDSKLKKLKNFNDMKHMNKIRMMIAASGLLVAASCSDYNDFNTVPSMADPAADKTLWENISSNADLTEFASVLERVGYDKVLSASRTYTVWAPVNGSFNLDSLNNVSDEKVEKEFLRNLIADYAHRESDVNDTVVYMLNEKLLKFSGKNSARLAFDGQTILPNTSLVTTAFNYPSVNGLLYIVSKPSVFRYNGYEYITEKNGLTDSFMAYFKHFENVRLDESASVKGAIIDGVQHYDDSVMIVSNLLAERLRAEIDNEDSLYTVLMLNDEAWKKTYEKVASYYKYIPSINYQNLSSDEVGTKKGTTGTIMKGEMGKVTTTLPAVPADAAIQDPALYWTDSVTRLRMVMDLIFSENNKQYNGKLSSGASFNEKDTLHSTISGRLTHLQQLDNVTEKTVKLSNGHARILNDFPFLPEETYAGLAGIDEVGRLVTLGESGYSIMSVANPPADICVLDEGVRTLRYYRTDLPEKTNFAPELDFYLGGVLSTTYTAYAVVVPACADPDFNDTINKPYTLYFDINYTDANNNQIAARFDGDTIQVGNANVKKVEPFIVAQEKVDTVKLGRITFPICYVGTEARPNIKVMHSKNSFLASTRAEFEQKLRIANIVLVPDGYTKDNKWR